MGKIQIVVFVIAKSPKIKANESGAMVASWSVASRLVHSTPDSTPDRAVLVQTLAGDIVVFLGKTLNSHSASLHQGV